MKKQTYIIISCVLVTILAILSTILIIKGPVKNENNKYGSEAKIYLKTFDLELINDDEPYYVIKGLTSSYGVSLTRVEIPSLIDGISVKKIITNENKFGEFKNVKSLFIPETIDFIGLDDYLTPNYFDGAINLIQIEVDEKNTSYASVNGVLYDYNKEALLKYPAGKTSKSYTTLDSTKKIWSMAFYGTFYLEEVIISRSVQTIDSSAFRNSDALKRVNFEDSSNLLEINELAFSNNKKLEEIILPDSLRKLGNSALSYNDSLKEVFIPANISEFGYSIVAGCQSVIIYTTSENLENLKSLADHFNTSIGFSDRITTKK